METLTNLGAFLLAVVAVIINGVPQLLYAQARGFAIKPAGFACGLCLFYLRLRKDHKLNLHPVLLQYPL